MTPPTLKINEIFFSIQDESTLAGKPAVFIRTATCNLRCDYCHTKFAFWDGTLMTVDGIVAEVKKYETQYVCVTGGEPMVQRTTIPLLQRLLDEGYIVSLETNGSISIKDVPLSVIKIIDIKCPDSGKSEQTAWENLDLVRSHDQFKFVVASKNDFDWAQKTCDQYKLHEKCTVFFLPVSGQVKPRDLGEWIISPKAKVPMQPQHHEEGGGPDETGV
jgi:7-carboxy-7-deazaguanine synthase